MRESCLTCALPLSWLPVLSCPILLPVLPPCPVLPCVLPRVLLPCPVLRVFLPCLVLFCWQVKLLKHMRRSTARDFKIQLEELTRAVRRIEEERDDKEQSQELRKVRRCSFFFCRTSGLTRAWLGPKNVADHTGQARRQARGQAGGKRDAGRQPVRPGHWGRRRAASPLAQARPHQRGLGRRLTDKRVNRAWTCDCCSFSFLQFCVHVMLSFLQTYNLRNGVRTVATQLLDLRTVRDTGTPPLHCRDKVIRQ